MTVAKPTVGSTGWDVNVDAVIDIVNAVEADLATQLHRVVEVNGVYPSRPSTGYSDFLGITDPSGAMQAGDTWTQLPATVPNAPTIGTATGGDASASVAFTAPSWNGGATITGYTATSTPGSLTGTGSSSPITVSGLTNGTAYTFKVKATNSAGIGAESAASNSVTPSGGGGGGGSLPTVSTGTLYAHFEADSLGLSDGASVTSWTKSGGSMSGNLASSGTAPTFQTNELNGKPAVRFSGGYLTQSAGTQNSPYTRFIVIRLTSPTPGTNTTFTSGDGSVTPLFFTPSGLGTFAVYSGASITGSLSNAVGTAAHVVEAVTNGASSSLGIDGTLTSGDAGSNPLVGLRVGADNTGAELINADVFEVVVYAGALDGTDRTAVRAYLGTKYGITVS